ncbi:hypothetical protein BCON_0025g00050 [Botryotinia convoluta]|uniref:Uncharacterized protein n=1 Tax=Botryotinia convoluta TaxID=54673 RepID=A0A4Z1IQV8_9HELO|nr:hypothetical protein BCON_0025g00050 [Botryotinia convoluta]
MSNYHGMNHASLPIIPSPRGPPNYRLSNPGYPTQMTSPYGQPNLPHPTISHSTMKRETAIIVATNLGTKFSTLYFTSADSTDASNLNLPSTVGALSTPFRSRFVITATERFREFLNNQLLELWTGKGRLFKEGFANSDNTPPPFGSRRIMRVILELTPKKLEDEIKMQSQKEEEQRQQEKLQRQWEKMQRPRRRRTAVATKSGDAKPLLAGGTFK